MGRKPVFRVAGLVLAGLVVAGCESSRSYQGSRMGGPGMASSTAQPSGWNNAPGVAGQSQGGVRTGNTVQQMPAGQPNNFSSQPNTVVRPNNLSAGPGMSGTNSLGTSQYERNVGTSVPTRPTTGGQSWSSSTATSVPERQVPSNSTLSTPSSGHSSPSPNTFTAPIDDGSTSSHNRLSTPSQPATDPQALPSSSGASTSRSIGVPPAPLPPGGPAPTSPAAPDLLPPTPPGQ